MARRSSPLNPLSRLSPARRRLLVAALVVSFGLLYAVVPQLSVFGRTRDVLHSTDWRYVGLAGLFFTSSLMAAVGVYRALVGPLVRPWPAFVVQAAGSFAGRILPLGLGSISLSYLYLRQLKLSRPLAGSTVAANNLLGMIGHVLLLAVLLIGWPLPGVDVHVSAGSMAAAAAVLVAVLAVLLVLRLRWTRQAHRLGKQVRFLISRPRRLLYGIGASLVITLCMALTLECSVRATGAQLGLTAALVALSAGLLAQSATPTPGGLGGVEAGLSGGLVVAGLSLDTAVAAALLFRFVTYWLPLGLGGAALAYAIRRGFVA